MIEFFRNMPRQAYPIVICWFLIVVLSIILKVSGVNVSFWLMAVISVFLTIACIFFAVRHKIPQIRRRIGLQ